MNKLLLLAVANGVVYNNTAGSFWSSHLSGLMPGDVLNLLPQTPGTPYTYTVNARNGFVLNGSPTNPIIVQGAPGEDITIAMNIDQNVVEVSGQYFLFQNLKLTATAGAPGAIGLRVGANTSHAVFRGITVFNVPETAITANFHDSIYDNVTFDGCEAYNTGGTGECIYVGCQAADRSSVDCRFINGALINNYCHDTCIPNGCNGGSEGSGYQLKGWGSYNNLVRNNVCARVNQVCVLLYDDWDLGPNIVEGNFIYGSKNDAGIQVSAGAIIRNNVIVGNKQGIVVTANSVNLQAGKSNRNIVVVGNTLVNNQGTGIVVPTLSPTAGSKFINNAVIEDSGNAFTGSDQTGVTWQNNAYFGGSRLAGVPSSGAKLVGSSTTELQDPVAYNFHPKAASALLSAGVSTTDATQDYACVTRGATPTIGAFEQTTGAALTLGFSPSCGAPTPRPARPTPASSSASRLGSLFSLSAVLFAMFF